jgi:SAM-dependent methyltransferase
MADLEALLPILACPRTGSTLHREDGFLVNADDSCRYPIRGEVPIFVDDPAAVVTMPTQTLSNSISEEFEAQMSRARRVLHLGAGGSRDKRPNCVELETAVYRHTDLVGDAHHLPFQDEVFDLAVAFNVFEHLRDPSVAASELHRVLIPGGRVLIQTAFLQPLHESPRHYFNATEFGLRQWFRMFATERVSVGPNQTIAIALGWFATTLTYYLRDVLDHPKAEEIADSTLRYWTDEWIEQQGSRDHQELWTEVETLPEPVQKTMAAGFEYVGTRLRTTDYPQSDPERPTETEDPKDVQIGQLLARISELELSVAWQQRQINKWWRTAEQLRAELTAPYEEPEAEEH